MQKPISSGCPTVLAVIVLVCASALPCFAPENPDFVVGSNISLTLDGTPCGYVWAVSGGGISGEVINETGPPGAVVKKHLGAPKYGAINLHVGVNLGRSLCQWIADSWMMTSPRRNGVLSLPNELSALTGAIQFKEALIAETTFPACDAGSEDPGLISVTLAPEETTYAAPEPIAAGSSVAARHPTWWEANFRLEIEGLDCSKVTKIDAFTVNQMLVAEEIGEQRIYRQATKASFPNLRITLPEAAAQTWRQWQTDFILKGIGDDSKERKGRLIFLSRDGQTELLSVDLFNLGICGFEPEPFRGGVNRASRLVTAELYCERMALNYGNVPAEVGATESQETAQVPSGNGELGKVYILRQADPLYFSLLGADYVVGPITIGDKWVAPNANEKLLVLRFTIRNPEQRNKRIRGDSLRIIATDAANANHPAYAEWGVAESHQLVGMEFMPQQELEMYTVLTVPARGEIPNLLIRSRVDNDGPDLPFDLRGKVTALPAPFADPADATGATARERVPAEFGVAYPFNRFSITVERVESVSTALDAGEPERGSRFLVFTLLMQNQTPVENLVRGDRIRPELTSTEGALLRYRGMLLATANRQVNQSIGPGDEMRVRIYFTVPEGSKPETLAITEGASRTYGFPVP